jgi:hypothetical protein
MKKKGEFRNMGSDGNGDYVFRNLVAQSNAQQMASAGVRKGKIKPSREPHDEKLWDAILNRGKSKNNIEWAEEEYSRRGGTWVDESCYVTERMRNLIEATTTSTVVTRRHKLTSVDYGIDDIIPETDVEKELTDDELPEKVKKNKLLNIGKELINFRKEKQTYNPQGSEKDTDIDDEDISG